MAGDMKLLMEGNEPRVRRGGRGAQGGGLRDAEVEIARDHTDLLPDLPGHRPLLDRSRRPTDLVVRAGQGPVAQGEQRAHPESAGGVDGVAERLLDLLGAG